MAGDAAAGLHPEPSGGEIEFVVERHHILGPDLEEADRLGERPAALVHIGLGLEDQNVGRPTRGLDDALPRHAQKAGALGLELVLLGDRVHRHEPEVVAIALVLAARIAEACQDQHG